MLNVRHWGQPRLTSLLITVLSVVGVALLIRESSLLQQRGAMLLMLGLVATVTWCFGPVNGVVALVGSIIVGVLVVLSPKGSFTIWDPEDWFRLGMFTAIGLLLITLQNVLIQSRRLAERGAQRLSFALRSARVGLVESNLRTGELWWSDNLPSMVGRQSDTFARHYNQFFDYIHPEDQDRVNRALTTMIEEGGMPELQFRIKSEDGRFVLVRSRLSAMYNDSNTPERIIAVVECVDGAP